MDILKHFLEKDQLQATLELKCIGDCLEQVIHCYKHNDFNKAKERTIDMLASLQSITNLAEDKQVFDRYQPHMEGIPTITHMHLTRMTRHE